MMELFCSEVRLRDLEAGAGCCHGPDCGREIAGAPGVLGELHAMFPVSLSYSKK